MATCNFCKEDRFQSEQGVKAHLKTCEEYLAEKAKKSRAASGSVPQAAAAPDLTASLRDLMKSMCEAMTKQDTPQTPQQQRRTILQAAKARVIDQYGTPLGQITASLRGAAKLQIEGELASLPLEEFPFEEVCEMAGAIRDRLYTVAFRQQAREADRLRVEAETRQKHEVETLGALIRADRRKTIFLQQANNQAHAYCQEKAIIGGAHASVLVDVKSRLEVLLTGDEPILEAQAIVRSVLEARFAEAEATLAAERAKATERWHEEVAAVLVLGTVVGLVVLAFKYPAQTVAIITWIERIFGETPKGDVGTPNPEAQKTTSPASSEEARPRSTRRRKYPPSPGPESPCAPFAEPMQGHA